MNSYDALAEQFDDICNRFDSNLAHATICAGFCIISGFDKVFEFITDLMNQYRDVDLTYANYLNDIVVSGLNDELTDIQFLEFPKFYVNDMNFSNFLNLHYLHTKIVDSVH